MEEPKTQTSPATKNTFLECERGIVFILMMLTAGYFGAFMPDTSGPLLILYEEAYSATHRQETLSSWPWLWETASGSTLCILSFPLPPTVWGPCSQRSCPAM